MIHTTSTIRVPIVFVPGAVSANPLPWIRRPQSCRSREESKVSPGQFHFLESSIVDFNPLILNIPSGASAKSTLRAGGRTHAGFY